MTTQKLKIECTYDLEKTRSGYLAVHLKGAKGPISEVGIPIKTKAEAKEAMKSYLEKKVACEFRVHVLDAGDKRVCVIRELPEGVYTEILNLQTGRSSTSSESKEFSEVVEMWERNFQEIFSEEELFSSSVSSI